jgi:hypothetical protein
MMNIWKILNYIIPKNFQTSKSYESLNVNSSLPENYSKFSEFQQKIQNQIILF